MKAALLPDRGVVKVAGDDARKFLNGLLTTDIAKVTPARAGFAALLTPQGKIIVDFIVAEAPAEDGGGFFLDCPRALAPALVERLNFYKLRAKVMVEDLSEVLGVLAVWDGAGRPPSMACAMPTRACRRWGCAACCRRIWPPRPRPISARSCSMPRPTRRIGSRSAFRAAASTSFMAMPSRTRPTWTSSAASISTRAAMSARKWSRASSIAAPRAQRVVPVSFDGFAPEAGTPVRAGEKDVGTLGSSAQGRGLAMLRLDRVADALAAGPPLIAGGIAMRLVKPAWARFAWPGEAKAAE